MLGISVVFLLCIKWNAFGLENKIPDKKEIVAANINCYFEIEENSESGIDEIMSIHQQIIDSKKEFQAYQGSSDLDKALQWVEIDYQLADGSIMVRSYDVPAAKIIMKMQIRLFQESMLCLWIRRIISRGI